VRAKNPNWQKAAGFLEMHRENLPYCPAAAGFIFANDEIATPSPASDAAVRRFHASLRLK